MESSDSSIRKKRGSARSSERQAVTGRDTETRAHQRQRERQGPDAEKDTHTQLQRKCVSERNTQRD